MFPAVFAKWSCERPGCVFETDDEDAWDHHVNNHVPCEELTSRMPTLTTVSKSINPPNSNEEVSNGGEEAGTAYVCPKCGRLCPDAQSVEDHMHLCGQPEPNTPRELEEISGGESGTGDNEEPGLSRRTYRCQICHERFNWHGNLTHHLEEAHNIVKKRCSGSTSKATWHCDKCNYTAMYESELERHKRLHKNIKPFKCIFCDYNSSWKSDLKRHYEGHHKDRLGDEKSLNSIMNCYQNNAGTQMEIQNGSAALDKNRLPVLLLTNGGEAAGRPIATVTPSGSNNETSRVEASEESAAALKSTPSPPALKLGRTLPSFACKQCDFVAASEGILQQHALFQHQQNRDGALHGGSTSSISSNGSNEVINLSTDSKASEPPNLPMLLPESYLKPPLISPFATGMLPPALQAYLKDDRPSFSPGLPNLVFPTIPPTTLASMMPIMSLMKNMPLPLYPTPQSALPRVDSGPVPPPVTPLCPSTESPNAELERISSFSGEHSGEENNSSARSRSRARGPNKSANERNYRRFKCSQCSHRSNWKWDINKHIKVAHPGAANACLIVLTEEEAMATLQQYLAESGGKKRSGRDREGYYRPFQCSECGKRSNWEWDINNHIKKNHESEGFVVKLTHEEAIETIEAYMNSKKHPSEIAASRDPSFRGSPRKDALNLKRFKCNDCGYRSNYRSDIKRHINRKHTSEGNLVILTEEEARDSLKAYVDNFPQRSNALFKKSIPPGLLANGDRCATHSSVFFTETDGRSPGGEGGVEPMDASVDGSDEMPETLTTTIATAPRSRMWACRFCNSAFRSINKPEVFKHIQAAHPNCKPFVCTICRYGSDYRNSLIRHIRTKHREMLQQLSPTAFCTTYVQHLREDTSASPSAPMEISRPSPPSHMPVTLPQHPILDHRETPYEDFVIDYSLPKGDVSQNSIPCDEEAAQWRMVKYKYNILQREPRRPVRRRPQPRQPPKLSRSCGSCTFVTRCRLRFLRHLQHHRRLARSKQRPIRLPRCLNIRKSQVEDVHETAEVYAAFEGYRCAICPFVAKDSEGYIQHVARHSRPGLDCGPR